MISQRIKEQAQDIAKDYPHLHIEVIEVLTAVMETIEEEKK
jgi:hypothetical protein